MTELKILREKLAESQKRQRELELQVEDLTDFIENAAIPLHWVNGSGVIIWANRAELELLGYSREEYIGKHVSNFHANKTVCEEILTRLIRKETLENYPAVLRSKTGQLIPVHINSNVRWDGEKFIHTRCFTRVVPGERQGKEQPGESGDRIGELMIQNAGLKKELKELREQAGMVKP